MTKTFIVAFDGSDQANKALDVAGAIVADDVADIGLPDVMSNRDISVAFRDFAEVEHVSDPPEHLYAQHVRDSVLAPAKERLSKAGIKAIRLAIESGDPAQAIVRFAEVKKADFIVMGSRGLSDLGGLVYGSVSHKVGHLAPCTCVTVH